jgi:hypothetical protein
VETLRRHARADGHRHASRAPCRRPWGPHICRRSACLPACDNDNNNNNDDDDDEFNTEPLRSSFVHRQRLAPLQAPQVAVNEMAGPDMASVVELVVQPVGQGLQVLAAADGAQHWRQAAERVSISGVAATSNLACATGSAMRSGYRRNGSSMVAVCMADGLSSRTSHDPVVLLHPRRQAPASRSMHATWMHEHATVNGGGFARSRTVADFRSFLSALVLAQPSSWAVFGPR